MKKMRIRRKEGKVEGRPSGMTVRDRRGFTLIEVMVAVALLVIGILGLIATATSVIQGNAISRQMTTAATLAEERMEILKRQSYTAADLTAGSHNDPGNPLSSIYTRTWTVTDNTPAANMKTVQVTVSWTRKGSAHNVNLNTIIAQ
jgi:prepilin-type N-terminal cleavage/methylation domain-containing protein